MTDEQTTRVLLEWAREKLAAAGCDRPREDAATLLAHLLGRLQVGLGEDDLERPLAGCARTRFAELVARRARREPLAYIVERLAFRSIQIAVDRRVLLPRPPTETLIEVALDAARASGWTAPRVADIGTGSGLVALCLALEIPGARVVATDASADALTVARLNVARMALAGVGDRITLRAGDLFCPLAGERYEIVVSNPPYVPTCEVENQPSPEMGYEPRAAFDGGPDGLDLVRRLVAGARAHLVAGGLLAVEHGVGQHLAVADLMRAAGFSDVAWRKDIGRIDRVTYGRV